MPVRLLQLDGAGDGITQEQDTLSTGFHHHAQVTGGVSRRHHRGDAFGGGCVLGESALEPGLDMRSHLTWPFAEMAPIPFPEPVRRCRKDRSGVLVE